jgi:hypothetical protein
MIQELETVRETSPEPLKSEIAAALAELRDLYAASFSPIDQDQFHTHDENTPVHIKRAKAIVDTLEAEDERTQ